MIREISMTFIVTTLAIGTFSGIWAIRKGPTLNFRIFWISMVSFLISTAFLLYVAVAPWAAAVPIVPATLFFLLLKESRRNR